MSRNSVIRLEFDLTMRGTDVAVVAEVVRGRTAARGDRPTEVLHIAASEVGTCRPLRLTAREYDLVEFEALERSLELAC